MNHEEKINYMRIAAGICGFAFRNDQMDLLVSLYELVLEKQGDADLKSTVQIEHGVKERERQRKIEEEKLASSVNDKPTTDN